MRHSNAFCTCTCTGACTCIIYCKIRDIVWMSNTKGWMQEGRCVSARTIYVYQLHEWNRYPSLKYHSELKYLSIELCLYICVGSCLATKVFYRQFASYEKGLGHHKVGQWSTEVNYQQNSYLPVIGVHSTMHFMHPNYWQITNNMWPAMRKGTIGDKISFSNNG